MLLIIQIIACSLCSSHSRWFLYLAAHRRTLKERSRQTQILTRCLRHSLRQRPLTDSSIRMTLEISSLRYFLLPWFKHTTLALIISIYIVPFSFIMGHLSCVQFQRDPRSNEVLDPEPNIAVIAVFTQMSFQLVLFISDFSLGNFATTKDSLRQHCF
jgi:hypothetical protein